jgi:hypothetical protein
MMPAAKRAAPEAAEQQEQQAVSRHAVAGSRAEAQPLPQIASMVTPEGDVVMRRDDDDVLTNSFAMIVSGEHAGRYVVVGSTSERGKDGWPTKVLVRTRDARDELLVVAYEDLRPAPSGRRA